MSSNAPKNLHMLAAARRQTNDINIQRRRYRIVVGEWALFRFDDFNFAIERANTVNDTRYYPNLQAGLTALFHRVLEHDCSDARDLRDVLAAIVAAERKVVEAVTVAGAFTGQGANASDHNLLPTLDGVVNDCEHPEGNP